MRDGTTPIAPHHLQVIKVGVVIAPSVPLFLSRFFSPLFLRFFFLSRFFFRDYSLLFKNDEVVNPDFFGNDLSEQPVCRPLELYR